MIGPGEDSLTPIAAISINGEVKMISSSEARISVARFINALPRLSSGILRRLISASPFALSICGLEDMYFI